MPNSNEFEVWEAFFKAERLIDKGYQAAAPQDYEARRRALTLARQNREKALAEIKRGS